MAHTSLCQLPHVETFQRTENTTFGRHVGYSFRVVLGSKAPSSVGRNLIASKTLAWHSSFLCVHMCSNEKKSRHRRARAADSDSAETSGIANCNELGNVGTEIMDFTPKHGANSILEDCTPTNFPEASARTLQASPESDVKRVHPEVLSNPSSNLKVPLTNDSTLNEPVHSQVIERVACSGAPDEISHSYGPANKLMAAAVDSSGLLQEGIEGRDRGFMESDKPSYVSLIWEAGSKIGVASDVSLLQDRSTHNNQVLSLVRDEGQRAQEEETILHCFWNWSRDSGYFLWAWAQNFANSMVYSFSSQDKGWKSTWKQSLLGFKIPRRVSEVNAGANQGTVWLPRDDTAFNTFFRNLSEIQKNILLMMAVHGKLAWIRLQQHFNRRLRVLENILATFPESEEELNAREAELVAFTRKLLKQSSMNQKAYEQSQEALRTAEEMISQLQTQVDQLKEDVASGDTLLGLLQKEGALSSQSLGRAAQSLSDAESRIVELEKRVQKGEEALYQEKEKLMNALRSVGLQEQARRVGELKVVELSTETASLKALIDSLSSPEHLSAQVKTLEEEIESRDLLLLEVKRETLRSTEALKLASQIKQDLNATRQREVQLTQSLESASAMVRELQEELAQNARASRAEQILKQTEKMLRDTKLEVELLRKGIEARDEAINIMKDEVDENIAVLANAARDREELRKMNRYIVELKSQLQMKDIKLSTMQEEMVLILNLAKQKQSPGSFAPNSDQSSASLTSSSLQMSPTKRKSQSQKEAGTRRTSQPRQQLS